jgi:ankyrin repeat protein
MNTAIEHLYMAAQFDNIEATCMIELYDVLLSYYSSGDLPSLASSEVSQVIKRMKNRCMSAHTSTADELGGIEPAKHMREWVRVNGDFIRRQPFFWHDGSRDRSYSWDSSGVTRLLEDISDYGQPICDVTVSYGSLLSSLNSGTFYEVAAANGLPALWKALEHMETLGGYEDSSWGDYNEVWSRLVNSAASNGQLRLLRQLIEEGSRQNVIHSSATGETPLHFLPILQETSHGLCTMIEDLVSLGISVDAPRTTRTWLPPFGTELYGTPLHVAVRARCLQSVKVLLMMGADPTVSFADNPSPLLLACALHLAEIVACLAKSKKVSPKDINEGLCALGFPTRKGWFERLIDSPSSLRKSSPTPYMLLLWRCMQTAVALTGQDDLSESPFLVKDDQKLAEGLAESARAFQYEFRQRRWELDGEPLIQAIRHGQRDPEAIYALLEMAMVPFSDHGRYGLLAAIVEGPGCKLDDPAALQFLRMVLGDRSSALVSHTNAAWAEWTSGWPAFFLTYRVPSSKIPVFHDWVYEGLIDAVRILIGLMKDLIPRLVQLRDHNNNTALDRAIDSGSKDMYLLLRPYGDTTIDQDLERARQKGPNRLLPTLVGIELDEQEREHLRNLVLLTGNHTLDDELKDIADSLETYGDWFLAVSGRAMMQVQSHLRARDSIRAQRARRMLMTCVRLRMHFQGVQNTELAKNEVVDAVVPTALRVMYDDDFTQLMPEWLLNRVMLGYDVSTEHGRRRNLANKEPFGQTIRRELEKAFGVRQHDGFTTSDLTELFRWLKGELSQVQKICDEHKSPNLPLQFRRDGQ